MFCTHCRSIQLCTNIKHKSLPAEHLKYQVVPQSYNEHINKKSFAFNTYLIHTLLPEITLTHHSGYKHHEKQYRWFLQREKYKQQFLYPVLCIILPGFNMKILLSFCFQVKVITAKSISYNGYFCYDFKQYKVRGSCIIQCVVYKYSWFLYFLIWLSFVALHETQQTL